MQSELKAIETDNLSKMANGRGLVKIPPRVLYLVLLILLVVIIVMLLPHKPHSTGHLMGVAVTNSQDAEVYTYDSTYPLTKPFGEYVYSHVIVAMRTFILLTSTCTCTSTWAYFNQFLHFLIQFNLAIAVTFFVNSGSKHDLYQTTQ